MHDHTPFSDTQTSQFLGQLTAGTCSVHLDLGPDPRVDSPAYPPDLIG